MTLLIWLAAATSAVTFLVHTFVGGPRVTVPLLKDQSLPHVSKWLCYYCWHITTVLLAYMAGAFAWLAMYPNVPSIVFLSALTATLSALSGGIAVHAGIAPWRLPSTSMFAVIAVLGALSIVLG